MMVHWIKVTFKHTKWKFAHPTISLVLQVGFDQSLEFTSMEGDLSKEDEGRLIEELANARDEIKNIKMRQAMVRYYFRRREHVRKKWSDIKKRQ